MLYDPKWNHGTLVGLITWLEGKPRGEVYDFTDCWRCPITQYMGSVPREHWSDEMRAIFLGTDPYKILRGACASDFISSQTYGAALERAYMAQKGTIS